MNIARIFMATMKSLCYFLGFVNLIWAADWGYDGKYGRLRPSDWKDDYPHCGYASESPIDIITNDTIENHNFTQFVFEGYDEDDGQYIWINNGHTAGVSLPNNISVSGGGLPHPYVAVQFHLHWGSVSTQGSEHIVDGKSYPAELHIVHRSSNYTDIGEAVDKKDGLAVLGIFFKLGAHNSLYDPMFDRLTNITYKDDVEFADAFRLEDLLPTDLTKFWRYTGSLTTPPCFESVIWTVFKKPVEVSEKQLDILRSLMMSEEGSNVTEPMVDNYRPIQPLGDRKVYSCDTSTTKKDDDDNDDDDDAEGDVIVVETQDSTEEVEPDIQIHWEYKGHYGASHWGEHYPHCGESSQSPIDIVRQDTIYREDIPPFSFPGYDKSLNHDFTLVNNGHTVGGLWPSTTTAMNVTGGGLPTAYIAGQFHFHWGMVDARGSEHIIDGLSYPLELHIVHYSSKYPDLFGALDQKEGLAVLGIFFKKGSHNAAFDKLVNYLRNISYRDEMTTIASFPLEELLPSDRSSFYRYSGSLTTPPCFESVIWTVFHQPVEISKEQLEMFRSMKKSEWKSNHSAPMAPNYRPVQPVHNRKVYTTVFDPTIHDSSSSCVRLSSFVILGLLCVSMLFS